MQMLSGLAWMSISLGLLLCSNQIRIAPISSWHRSDSF